MNRLAILTFLILLSASSVSAVCTQSDLFDPDFSVSTLRFPSSIEAIASGNPIGLELSPDGDVEDVRLHSVTASSEDIRADFLVERVAADSYMLTPRFYVGSGLTLEELEDLEFSFEARVSYVRNGERFDETICLDDLDVSIAGGVDAINDFAADFERTLRELENADSVFDLIDALIGATRLINEVKCEQANATYETLETSFDDHCAAWTDETRAVVDGEATPAAACAALGDETLIAQCQANLTGDAPNCPNLYAKMLEAEKNASDVCYRNACAPVLNVSSHASSYLDPLDRSTCDGTDITDPACQAEYERVQGPRCPGANVTTLAKAGTSSPLMSLANICTEEGARSEVTILKDPTSDIVSSTTCMCLPALQGHIGQLERLYEYGRECLGEDSENSTRDCKQASMAFWCDMAVGTALQCGGIGYQEFSASTNVFADANGDPLDFDDPDAVAAAIEDGGYVRSGSGSLSVDPDRLGRAICSSALGDEDVDWASVLSFDASVSGETGTLCRQGVELTEPCVCDLSAVSEGSLQTCGTSIASNQCTYDVANRDATCGPYEGSADPNTVDLGVSPSVGIGRFTRDDAQRTLTSWPAGSYGSRDGFTVTQCSELPASFGTDTLRVKVASGAQEMNLLLTSGPVSIPATGSGPGLLGARLYSCDGDRLRIAYETLDGGSVPYDSGEEAPTVPVPPPPAQEPDASARASAQDTFDTIVTQCETAGRSAYTSDTHTFSPVRNLVKFRADALRINEPSIDTLTTAFDLLERRAMDRFGASEYVHRSTVAHQELAEVESIDDMGRFYVSFCLKVIREN